MAENLIPVEEVTSGASSVRDFKEIETFLKNSGRTIANGSYITPVTNGKTEIKDLQKNKIASISCDKKEIVPDELVTYTVKLDEKEKDKVKTEIKQVKFCLWFQHKDEKGKTKKLIIDTKITPAGVILVSKRNATPRHTNILEPREDKGETLTGNLNSAYYYANIIYTENEAKLEIKYSKWMDSCRIRVEAYFKKKLQDGGNTTASRWVKATPEILEAYWLNAESQKVNYAGYNQDLYLYLKTLGLKDKEIEVQVHEQDYYHTPANAVEFPLSNKKGDELIEWKNNQIKIDNNGEALKQFKIGDKNRYEEAQKDEKEDDYKKWYDEQISKGYYFVGFDPTEKYGADLELYIHFPEKGEFKPNKDNQFAKLTLTDKTMIMDAYFATTEKHKVQTDAPATKKNANPTGKVTQYIKQDKGVLGQTIQLVAECPNLEGKKVTFQIFEKTPLLGEEDKPLTLINKKGEEKTRIEANVKESFAVAEVKLQHCKEDADNEDWARILFPDTVKKKKDLKFSELYIKVEATKNVFIIKSNGEFLKDNPFKFSTNTCSCNKCINYQDVKSNPILNTQTYENKNRFKKAKRYRSSGKVYYHRGTDVLAKTGTDVHSLLCGEVANFGHRTSFKTNQYAKDSFGNTVVIKSKDKDDKIIYIKYCHLDSVSVKKGDKIIHNQIIAKSGSTGNAATILYTSGSKKGKLKNGIKEEHRHIHIEASRNKNFSNSRTGNENDPETYMKTKFDKDGKVIE